MNIRWYETYYLATAPIYPDRIGSPSHAVKHLTRTLQAKVDGEWIDVPVVKGDEGE